jgi:hypothetical protein
MNYIPKAVKLTKLVPTTAPSMPSIPTIPTVLTVLTVLTGFSPLANAQTNGTQPPTDIAPVSIEMHRLDIPEINGAINVPGSWSIVTFSEAKLSVENTEYISQEAKDIALKAAETVGSQSLKIAKEVEPYKGLNYSISIAWSPITNPNQVDSVPVEARSEVSARLIEKQMLPKIQSLTRDFKLVEGPTQIDAKGSGAWVTYEETVIKKETNPNTELEGTLVTRLYLLTKPDNFIIVSLSFPKTDAPKDAKINKDILGEMLKSFEVLR